MTEYVISLRNMVSGPARDAQRDVDRLRASLGAVEASKTTVGGGRAARASGGTSDSAARNAAFRRLQRAQAEEENFTRYRIRLMRKEVAEREKAESQQLAAELRRIRAAQRAEAQAAQASKRSSAAAEKANARSGGMPALGGLIAGAGIGAAVGAGLYIGGQALDTAQQIENARMRFTALLGSVEKANSEIKDSFRIAEKTVFDPREVMEALARLATNFKNEDSRRYIFASISDFVTASGKGNEGLERAVKAINDIASKGRLQQSELTTQLSELGLSSTAVYVEIAKMLSVKGKTESERNQKVIKLISAGKVASDVGIQAITNAMRTLAGGGPAGQFAVKSSDTLSGIISNIQGGFATLFAMSDIEKWPALVLLKDSLRDVAGFFSVDSKEGAAFMTVLRALSGAAAYTFKAMADVITLPARAMFSLIGAVQNFLSEDLLSGDTWINLGRSIVQGIAGGIRDGATYVYDALRNLSLGAVQTVKDKLGIQSPSKVMAQLGGYTGEGFARGIEGGAGRVRAAAGGLGDAAVQGASGRTVSARAGGSASGGGGVNITINLPVTTAGNAQELAEQAAPLLEQQLDRYFGRLAQQGV